jgi:ankyrin repeat protein
MTPTLLSLPSKLLQATAFCKVWPADVTLRSCKNRSVVWYAAKGANVKVVQTLLDTGKLDHNAADNDCMTPFACAASEGHCEVMRLLLSLEGVDPDCRMYQGRTPLFLAAGNGRRTLLGTYWISGWMQTPKLSIGKRHY